MSVMVVMFSNCTVLLLDRDFVKKNGGRIQSGEVGSADVSKLLPLTYLDKLILNSKMPFFLTKSLLTYSSLPYSLLYSFFYKLTTFYNGFLVYLVNFLN